MDRAENGTQDDGHTGSPQKSKRNNQAITVYSEKERGDLDSRNTFGVGYTIVHVQLLYAPKAMPLRFEFTGFSREL